MTHAPLPRRIDRLPLALCGLLALFALTPAASAAPPDRQALAQAQARYQQERAACLAGQTSQDRATCLKEAGAALAEARRGGLDGDPSQYAANQRQRCLQLPSEEQRDCLARMSGRGSVQGSVAGGGVLRELVTREVVVPAAPASAASR